LRGALLGFIGHVEEMLCRSRLLADGNRSQSRGETSQVSDFIPSVRHRNILSQRSGSINVTGWIWLRPMDSALACERVRVSQICYSYDARAICVQQIVPDLWNAR
jgi:hypothetical protein